ncbi:hypothetical protein VP01_111g11 [Puccinia sorghi]|uniref:Uncharacterized protein n=1 Tax=Puccinia sorghi TaxID=27349 RepID=A0A0L6VSF4_9BASI|nr:hypothetical protein VP01_111g11 [Puccinia sorghi]
MMLSRSKKTMEIIPIILHELTQNVCIFFLITGFAAWRQEFKQHQNGIEGRNTESLSVGYGIHWKIKYESRRLADNPREVSKATNKNFTILGHFNKIQFIQANRMQIKNLKDVLNTFKFLNKEMEVDGTTSAFVLANYYQKIKDLKTNEAASAQNITFHTIYHKIITKFME